MTSLEWTRLHSLETRRTVGLMSGTSADGVDAALVDITGSGPDLSVEVLEWLSEPYTDAERREILALSEGDAAHICQMDARLAERFAEAALNVIHKSGTPIEDVHLIGSHGQTVYHIPPGSEQTPSTLQIGHPTIIAERTGITTVGDFRPRDMAAGGQGAPLVPYVDWVLFRKPDKVRCLLNIGGIANVTVVTPNLEDVIAFDTGPGNMVIDAAVNWITSGAKQFDEDGLMAAASKPDSQLLEQLLNDEYLRQPPPKSTGRERYGKDFAERVFGKVGEAKKSSLVSTMTSYVAESIARAIGDFGATEHTVEELIVTGGGASNHELMRRLRSLAEPMSVSGADRLGIPSEAKEAIAFAVLANETICGIPANVPSATGARGPRILGVIAPGGH